MEERIYRDMALFQETHWWFKARRNVLCDVIRRLDLPEHAYILEIGCGTGGNIDMLRYFGQVFAVDSDESAIVWAAKISGLRIDKGSLPNHLPSYPFKFDLICLFDVLEHIERDSLALKEVVKLLRPKGQIIITVPAHMFLFGVHDRNMHHFRRYSKRDLKQKLMASGLEIVKISYFNMLLFPILILTRCLDCLIQGRNSVGYAIPPPFFNRFLYRLFSMERQIINIMDMPVGASLLAVCRKN